jgi:uncharacterized membrane protein
MVWFGFAFCAAVLWALGQIFIKKGFSHFPPLWSNIVGNVLSLFIWVPFVLCNTGFSIKLPPLKNIGIILGASSLYHLFYYSIFKGQISLTGTLVAGYPIFTIALSHIFLGERLTIVQYLGITLILIGDVVFAIPEKTGMIKDKRGNLSWILWGLVGACTIGSGDFIAKFSINQIGVYRHMLTLALFSNAVSSLNYLLDIKNRDMPKILSRRSLPSFAGIIITLIGSIFFLLAMENGAASLIVSISSVYPGFVALLAVRFLGEKVSIKQITGIITAVLGLILIGLGML